MLYHVTKIATIIIEKGVKFTEEERKILYKNGFYTEEIEYYNINGIKLTDKERIRMSDLVFIYYKNKISKFSIEVIKYASKFGKKIIINNEIVPYDF